MNDTWDFFLAQQIDLTMHFFRYRNETVCFKSIRSANKRDFTVHPEWVSENLTVQRISLQDRYATYPGRRCRSAPAAKGRYRNPITWEYWSPEYFLFQYKKNHVVWALPALLEFWDRVFCFFNL